MLFATQNPVWYQYAAVCADMQYFQSKKEAKSTPHFIRAYKAYTPCSKSESSSCSNKHFAMCVQKTMREKRQSSDMSASHKLPPFSCTYTKDQILLQLLTSSLSEVSRTTCISKVSRIQSLLSGNDSWE